MKNRLLLLCIFATTILIEGRSQTCAALPSKYNTYEEANRKIKASTWVLKDSKMTPESSWIRRISYYSCDGKIGFLLILTDGKEYIHSNFPRAMWDEFVVAPSKGSYYNRNVRDRFVFYL